MVDRIDCGIVSSTGLELRLDGWAEQFFAGAFLCRVVVLFDGAGIESKRCRGGGVWFCLAGVGVVVAGEGGQLAKR